jgi:hypothetical protein
MVELEGIVYGNVHVLPPLSNCHPVPAESVWKLAGMGRVDIPLATSLNMRDARGGDTILRLYWTVMT